MSARPNSWLDRHPSAADAALAAVLLGFSLITLFGQTSGAGAAPVVLSVLLTAPLALRRRAPVGVFATVMVVAGAQLVFVDDFLAANVAVLIALYTLVADAPRRVAGIGFGVALAGVVPFAFAIGDPGTAAALLTWIVAWVHLALAAALGDRAHNRLAEREALREHARLLAAERDRHAVDAVAAERARIARDLHDVVAHSLSVVIHQADGGRYAAERDPRAATAALHTIARTAREAQAEMRRALGVLGGGERAPLAPQPGLGDLPALVARMEETGLAVRFAQAGAPRELGPGAELTVYRIVQEALTNVLKHAGPGAVATIALDWEGDDLTIVVRDDGRGATAGDGEGRGLVGMRERIEPRGGTLRAGPHPAGGFEVRAAIPAGPGLAAAQERG